MKILLLGGQGFIGYNLIKRLLQDKHEVWSIGRSPKKYQDEKYAHIMADYQDIDAYREELQGTDVVYHLVSTTRPKESNENMAFDVTSNVIATIKLLDFCRTIGVKKVIFSSSGGTVYGTPQSLPITEEHPTNPICSYGISKLAIEKYLFLYHTLFGLEYQILRISNPYGPYQNIFAQQGVVGIFLAKILQGKEIQIWGDGMTARDYIYIDDVVDALYAAALHDVGERVLNIGWGKATSLNDLLAYIRQVSGADFKVVYQAARQVDLEVNVLDITKAKAHLHWQPQVALAAGLEKTWAWVKDTYGK